LAAASNLRQVTRKALQCAILLFRLLVSHVVRTAYCLERFAQRLHRRALLLQQFARGRTLLLRQREQQVFGGDVLVPQRTRGLLRNVENLIQFTTDRGLRAARLLRQALDACAQRLAQPRNAHVDLLEDRNDDRLLLSEQRAQQMEIFDCRIAATLRVLRSHLYRFRRLDGQPVRIQHTPPRIGRHPPDGQAACPVPLPNRQQNGAFSHWRRPFAQVYSCGPSSSALAKG